MFVVCVCNQVGLTTRLFDYDQMADLRMWFSHAIGRFEKCQRSLTSEKGKSKMDVWASLSRPRVLKIVGLQVLISTREELKVGSIRKLTRQIRHICCPARASVYGQQQIASHTIQLATIRCV